MKTLLACLATLFFLCCYHCVSHGATWFIKADGSGDAPTIQAGLDSAAVGDTVLLAEETFSGTGNRDISYLGKAVVVRSVFGDPTTCVIDVAAAPPNFHTGFIFSNGEGPETILEGVTITNGSGNVPQGGAIECSGSSPRIKNCVLVNNEAYYGGGMTARVSGSPSLEDCVFTGNEAYADGAISVSLASITVTGCEFYNNIGLADGAGAIGCSQGSLTIDGCIFAGNYSKFDGSGIVITQGSTAMITGCTFYGNSAIDGSAVSVWWGAGAVSIQETIVAFSTSGDAISGDPGCADVSCTNIYGNAGGDWTGCIAGQNGVNGNLSTNPLFCDPENGDFSLIALSDCLPGNNSCGVLMGAIGQGCDTPTGIAGRATERLPGLSMFTFPNPFNPTTTISFVLPERAFVKLAVFDVEGRLVKRIVEGNLDGGPKEFAWDGKDFAGQQASSGIYFCRLSVGQRTTTRKMVLVR